MLGSDEYFNHVIQQFFQSYLRRAVDPSGLAYWRAALQRGGKTYEVADQILASDERFGMQ